MALGDLDARLLLGFLDHLEKDRKNGARSRNARLAALRSFLKYAAHYDLTALPVIEQALAIPMKRFDRPLLGFLSRQEMQAILEAPDPRTWAGQRDRALFTLMYNTARECRRSSACGSATSSSTVQWLRTSAARGARNEACRSGDQPRR